MGSLPRIGAWIAAVAAPALLASLFVDWYELSVVIAVLPGPGGVGISGWDALGSIEIVLLCAAVAFGPQPLLAQVTLGGPVGVHAAEPESGWVAALRRMDAARWTAAVAGLVALGAALLAVFRISEPPEQLLDSPRLAGPFIALAGSLGIAGGALLAVAGDRLFEVVPRARLRLGAIAIAAAVIIVSLWLPWYEPTTEVAARGASSVSGWEAFRVADALIAVGGVALLASTAVAAALCWRSAFLALALGGWLAAAIVVFAGPHAAIEDTALGPAIEDSTLEFRFLYDYAAGYYLALAAAGAISLIGLGSASHRPPTGSEDAPLRGRHRRS
jgi:hypothetical protein